jgi:pimeloyl-ACP methyl ester carboxylesterase
MVKFIIFSFLLISCANNNIRWPSKTHYKFETVNGHKIFYREAGENNSKTILLLHGYPSSSHTYRELIPLLSEKYHIIAPDNLGSGFSDKPSPQKIKYTFDLLAKQVEDLLINKKIKNYYIYMQDFGAPVGYRLASPERVKGLIIQNANAYLEGLSEQKQQFFMTAGDEGSNFPVEKLFGHVSEDAIINKQYLRDIPIDKKYIMSPDTWTHDLSFLKTKEDKLIQIQLFKDYRSNLLAYPKWQKYLREHQPPALIVWGKHDPVFMSPGAKAYLRDIPSAELHLLDAGHFALEEKPTEIAKYIHEFID